jgi:hypothetical protein
MAAEWLTYREAANHFGSSIEAVRRPWHINRFYWSLLAALLDSDSINSIT